MTTDTVNALLRRSAVLVAILAPGVLLAVVYFARTGRDLSHLLLVGMAAYLGVGIVLLGIGFYRRNLVPASLGGAVLLFLCFFFLTSTTIVDWIGSTEVEVTVTVRDADTGQPIPKASVRLGRPMDEAASTGITDKAGRVHLKHGFMSSGKDGFSCRTGLMYLGAENLMVSAEEYGTVRGSLERWRYKWTLYGPPLPTIEVHLKKGTSLGFDDRMWFSPTNER